MIPASISANIVLRSRNSSRANAYAASEQEMRLPRTQPPTTSNELTMYPGNPLPGPAVHPSTKFSNVNAVGIGENEPRISDSGVTALLSSHRIGYTMNTAPSSRTRCLIRRRRTGDVRCAVAASVIVEHPVTREEEIEKRQNADQGEQDAPEGGRVPHVVAGESFDIEVQRVE